MDGGGSVEFHTGVADPVGFACRLLRKAWRQRSRVLVTAPADRLALLDRALWTFDEREFIPHLRAGAPGWPQHAARTPLWLAPTVPAGIPAAVPPVLVNLGAEAPADLAPFSRVIEVVGADPDEAAAGRARWRAYKGQGLTITHHVAAG